jgi:SSS family solute:Na+ symporter
VTLGLGGLQNGYPHGSFLWIVNNIYFQYFSVLVTVVSAIVMVVVSYATSEPDYAAIQSLTFATTTPEDKAHSRASWSWREVTASAVVVLGILGAYLYFRG